MISVVVPISLLVRKSLNKRIETMKYAIENFYKDVELIVVEQSLDGEFYFLPHLKECKKIKIHYPVFNKSWCINVGVAASKHDYVAVCDCDMYSTNYEWGLLLYWMKNNRHKWAFGWNRLVYTNDEQRTNILLGDNQPKARYVNPVPGYSEGGIVVFEKDFFNKIGKFNEFMVELGGIDTEIIIRCRYLYNKYASYPAIVYHLWHPQVKKSSRPTRYQNIRKIRHCKNNTDMVINWLSQQYQGNLDTPLVAKKEYFL